ncbi:hypothetical protein QBC36DRAFT_73772 [Triangularia setosa]|uniref:Uncharacterized protein n=1 Tax=Triangularia setosa TaxID=2587417 RepID=A0AAN6W2G9_9PEZI|nr:hypothetical protein QBC36DRAFT_73772 [Podospora setosa]
MAGNKIMTVTTSDELNSIKRNVASYGHGPCHVQYNNKKMAYTNAICRYTSCRCFSRPSLSSTSNSHIDLSSLGVLAFLMLCGSLLSAVFTISLPPPSYIHRFRPILASIISYLPCCSMPAYPYLILSARSNANQTQTPCFEAIARCS